MPAPRERVGRCPDRSRRPAVRPARARVEPGRREPAVEERVDAVGRREHEPRVATERRAARSRPARPRSTAARSPRRRAARAGRAARSPARAHASRRCAGRTTAAARTSRDRGRRPSPITIALGASTPSSVDRRRACRARCVARAGFPSAPRRPAWSASRPPAINAFAISRDAARAHQHDERAARRARARPSRCRSCPSAGSS